MTTVTTNCQKCGKTIQNKEPGSFTYVKDIRNPDFCKCEESKTTPARELLEKIMELIQCDLGSTWWLDEDKAEKEIRDALIKADVKGYSDGF